MNVATLGSSTNINTYKNVKKSITTLAFALSIIGVSAQRINAGMESTKPSPNAKLISTTVDGDYKVQKWLVPQGANDDTDKEFSVRYQVNVSRMISSYDDNSKEILGLNDFINEILNDEQKGIKRINICGYASPDGNNVANKRLATARAVDCRNFINKTFDLSKYTGKTVGIAQSWSATDKAVTKSTIPNKYSVLDLIMSSQPSTMIEQKLKNMPASWRYMVSNILPPMRCVEIEIVYTGCETVVTRTLIEPEVEVVEQNIFVIFTERPSDVYTLSNPKAAPIDFKNCRERRCGGDKGDKMRYKIKNRHHKESIKRDSRTIFRRHKERVVYR